MRELLTSLWRDPFGTSAALLAGASLACLLYALTLLTRARRHRQVLHARLGFRSGPHR